MDWKYVIEEAYTENNNLNVYDDGHRNYAGFGVSYAHENYFVGVDVIMMIIIQYFHLITID